VQVASDHRPGHPGGVSEDPPESTRTLIDAGVEDRDIVLATQAGLPLVQRPYDEIAGKLGVDEQVLMERLRAMLAQGMIRRIAAVPNHFALGYRANGMSVWDIRDERITHHGRRIGALPFVSHCYHRPRRPPLWRYNLFAMVHGRDREEVNAKVSRMAELLGVDALDHDVLYSTRILKKTGLRLNPGT